MNTTLSFTELEKTLLVSNSILSKTDSLVRALKDWDVKENDYVYIAMKEALILEICKYMEEYDNHIIPILTDSDREWIIKVHSPLYDCINNSQLRLLRNRHIAHPHRDRKGEFIFLMDTVLEEDLDVNDYDILFLGECTTRMILLTASRLKDEVTSAITKYESHLKTDKYNKFFNPPVKFDNYEDVTAKLSEVIGECDRLFHTLFPDKEAWESHISDK